MINQIRSKFLGLSVFSVLIICSLGSAKDWYVSATTGSGRSGTIEKPAKDLGNLIPSLEDGDRVFIAEGTYLGRGENGHDLLNVAIEIYGGWSTDFQTRDPWGAHKTIFSGNNLTENWEFDYRLKFDLSKRRDYTYHKIVVDGLIIDNGARNRYADENELLILRLANPSTGQNATPGTGGLQLRLAHEGKMVVKNNIILNTAPSEGVFSLWGHQNSKALVENNLAINNTGNGFSLHTQWHPREVEGLAEFTFRNNASLFNHKYDAFASYGGAGIYMEADTAVSIENSLSAFNDFYGLDNGRQSKDFVFNNNVTFGNLVTDYLEFDTRMDLEEMIDESFLYIEAEDNTNEPVTIPVSESYASFYAQRNVIDRNAAEQDVAVLDTRVNAWRSMLGLNVQGSALEATYKSLT